MQDNKCGDKLAAALKGRKIDILINNAGYFYEPVEKVDSLNFEEVHRSICATLKMILHFDIFFLLHITFSSNYPIDFCPIVINICLFLRSIQFSATIQSSSFFVFSNLFRALT